MMKPGVVQEQDFSAGERCNDGAVRKDLSDDATAANHDYKW